MKIGYARVSTLSQDLETQIEMLNQAGAEKIYADKWTGTSSHRPEFDKLKQKLRYGDELIVTKLDRVSRSVTQGAEFIDELLQEGVTVNILNLGKLDNTATGKLIRNIFLSFAEFERDLIVIRTQEGKAHAKATKPDYREGRPRRAITPQYRAAYVYLETHSYKQTAEAFGISERTIQRIKLQIEQEEHEQESHQCRKIAQSNV